MGSTIKFKKKKKKETCSCIRLLKLFLPNTTDIGILIYDWSLPLASVIIMLVFCLTWHIAEKLHQIVFFLFSLFFSSLISPFISIWRELFFFFDNSSAVFLFHCLSFFFIYIINESNLLDLEHFYLTWY